MTLPRDSAQENAAASEVLAGARLRGVRSADFRTSTPQRPVPRPAGAFSLKPPMSGEAAVPLRIALRAHHRTCSISMRDIPCIPTQGQAAPAGPIIVP